MFGISFLELVVIFLLVLLFLGPEKLPEAARWAGKGLRELRKASNSLRNALEMEELERDLQSFKSITTDITGETAARKKVNREKIAAQKPAPKTPAPAPQMPEVSGGLDQIDDEYFEKMLAQEFADRQVSCQAIALAPALVTDELIHVPLAPAAGPGGCAVVLPGASAEEVR